MERCDARLLSFSTQGHIHASSNFTRFKNVYPYSTIGLSFNLTIFTGFSRIESIHESSLEEDVLDLSEISLKSQILYRIYRGVG